MEASCSGGFLPPPALLLNNGDDADADADMDAADVVDHDYA